MKIIAILLCLFAPLWPDISPAGTLTMLWTPPTMCTDGTPITGCPVTGYHLYSVACTGAVPLPNPLTSLLGTAGPTATTFAALNTPDGTKWCVTIASLSASGEGPQSSTAVGPVSVSPGAPATLNLSSTLKTTATAVYLPVQIPNGWSFLQVGTVPIGTPCMAGHGVEQYNIVLQGSITVTWSSAVQPLTIVGLCQ